VGHKLSSPCTQPEQLQSTSRIPMDWGGARCLTMLSTYGTLRKTNIQSTGLQSPGGASLGLPLRKSTRGYVGQKREASQSTKGTQILTREMMAFEIQMPSRSRPMHNPQLEHRHLHWTLLLLQYPNLRKQQHASGGGRSEPCCSRSSRYCSTSSVQCKWRYSD
jgi:hypothetical protein